MILTISLKPDWVAIPLKWKKDGGDRILRLRWQQRPRSQLVRWKDGLALLVALPPVNCQVRCFRTRVGVKVDGEFC
ncbi:MAG: hypothetical protein ACUVSC_13035, partial [Candidatus Fervidibacter sp.]